MVIAIGFKDTRESIIEDVKEMGLEEIIFTYDVGNKVAKQYGITYVAASVFIGKDGIVSKRLVSGFNEPQLLKEIYRIIK